MNRNRASARRPALRAPLLPIGIVSLAVLAGPGPRNSATAAEAPGIATAGVAEGGWIPLFNGRDLSGWKASENPATFRVEDGQIVVHGDRSHLFYVGDVMGAEFRDFDLLVEAKTEPGANSGVYFHTAYQEEGWPDKGYEAQVNASHADPRRTGGLYGVADVMDVSPVPDHQWFTMEVSVRGKRIIVRVDGEVTADYTETDAVPMADRPGRRLGSGTIALQGHDPGSLVRYRKVWIRPAP